MISVIRKSKQIKLIIYSVGNQHSGQLMKASNGMVETQRSSGVENVLFLDLEGDYMSVFTV